jgi:hypothetical protein
MDSRPRASRVVGVIAAACLASTDDRTGPDAKCLVLGARGLQRKDPTVDRWLGLPLAEAAFCLPQRVAAGLPQHCVALAAPVVGDQAGAVLADASNPRVELSAAVGRRQRR